MLLISHQIDYEHLLHQDQMLQNKTIIIFTQCYFR